MGSDRALTIYQVDAFSSRLFHGNPAAVCVTDEWLPESLMRAIARENNLSETAFAVAEEDGYRIRWFTPAIEVDLCGHATLATAHVLFYHLGLPGEAVRFDSRSGELWVRRNEGRLQLDFPALPAKGCYAPAGLVEALGVRPLEILAADDYLVVLENERSVRAVRPDYRRLAELDRRGVIITSPGDDVDFVSRFFAPGAGIDEDPVTGSAHCSLAPYWAQKLGRDELRARQVSERGGELWCEVSGDRVLIAGHAVTYMIGVVAAAT